MVSLLYACGLRVSELINLKNDNLDFEEKIGYVKQAKGKKDRIFNIPSTLIKNLKKQDKDHEIVGTIITLIPNRELSYTWY